MHTEHSLVRVIVETLKLAERGEHTRNRMITCAAVSLVHEHALRIFNACRPENLRLEAGEIVAARLAADRFNLWVGQQCKTCAASSGTHVATEIYDKRRIVHENEHRVFPIWEELRQCGVHKLELVVWVRILGDTV